MKLKLFRSREKKTGRPMLRLRQVRSGIGCPIEMRDTAIAEARPAAKRPATGLARERAIVKKKRRLAPSVGPRQEPPTVIG